MRTGTFDLLRCPFCGGRLSLVDSPKNRIEGDEILDAILGCHCCAYPIVDGIPVLHLEPAAARAREQIEAGRPDLAMRAMVGFTTDAQAGPFEELARSPSATYRELVDALGPGFEGGYFLYRFSDPTYVVADAVVHAVAGVVLEAGGRAIDVCGGSGHLTRSLLDLSPQTPVLADLYFAKLWLARRFTAPGCEVVCCDGNAPLPFPSRAFTFAVCSDAFHYIWTKRLLASEMMRLVAPRGALAVTHVHSAHQWNPSAGMPLPPDGYLDLFEGMAPHLFAESELLDDLVAGGPLDLSRRDALDVLNAAPALTLVATNREEVFRMHRPKRPVTPHGEFRINPLYVAETSGDDVTLRLRFPSADYEQEYGACRQYLPDEILIDSRDLAAVFAGRLDDRLRELVRRRVILDLPKRWV